MIIKNALKIIFFIFLTCAPVCNAENVTVTGCLYNESINTMGVSNLDVNPFYAYWFIRCYDFDGNTYQEQLDARGCFSIKLPSAAKSYIAVFLNQNEVFQAGLCFPEYGKDTPRAYHVFLTGSSDIIDFGRLTVDGYAAVPDLAVQRTISVDMNRYARDTDNDGIPDGFDTEGNARYYENVINFDKDLDNDGVPDDLDIDIDGDGIPNDIDPDMDDDGTYNEYDDDNNNDGIIDSLEPQQPRVTAGDLPDPFSGTVNIPLILYDDNGDKVDLTVRYSKDGGVTYHIPTLIDTNLKGLFAHPVGIKHAIIWDTAADFGSSDINELVLELIPSDYSLTGDALVVNGISVRNNNPPEVLFITPKEKESYSGSISIEWKTVDPDEGQNLKAYGLWMSLDMENYILLSDDIPASGSYEWDLSYLGAQSSCQIAIAITDGYSDASATTGTFKIAGESFLQGFRIVSPSEVSQQFGSHIPIEWESGNGYTLTYDIYASQDGFAWTLLAQQIDGNSWIWDIHEYANMAGIRIMIKAQGDGKAAYAFSPQIIIKNINRPPQITVYEPENGAVLSQDVRILWESGDPDPGDEIKWISIEYTSPETNEKKQVVRLDSDSGEYVWDISQLPDMSGYELYITLSDGELSTSVNIANLRIDNPPYLVKVNQTDSETVEVLFSENVNNVYRAVSFSEGASFRSMRRLGSGHYILKTTPLSSDTTYTMTFDDTITDDSGQCMRAISVQISGIADIISPELQKPVTPIDSTHIDIIFSEPVLHADTTGAYSITPSLDVYSVTMLKDGLYRLVTESQSEGISYEISFKGITDAAGNKLTVRRDQALFEGFSSEKIIRVDPRGNGDFSDINSALRNAGAGAYIQLAAGIYENGFHILDDMHITIEGGFNPKTWQKESGLESVITAPENQTVVTCAGIARLIDLRITGGQTGIKIYSGHCVMFGCSIFDNVETGMYIMHKATVAVINCSVYGNKHFGVGIYSDHSAMVINSVIYNNANNGITISALGKVVLANNIVMMNLYGVFLEKCLKGIPVITHTCFYKNNRGVSLEGSYSVLDSCGDMLYVINTSDKLNQPDRGWVGNMVEDPQWDESFNLKDSSPLVSAGTDLYINIFNLLPDSCKPDVKSSAPVGLIGKK